MLLTYDPLFFSFLPCRLLTPLPQSSSLKEHHACPRCLRWPYRHFPHRCSLILVWAAQPQQDSLQVNIALSAIFIARTIHADAMMSHLFFNAFLPQVCLCLLGRLLSTRPKSLPTPHLPPGAVAIPLTQPITWCPPRRRSKEALPTSSKRRL